MTGSATPSSDENRRTAMRFFEEVWNARRDQTIDEVLHPSIEAHMEGADFTGIAGYKEARAAILSAFPDMRVSVDATAADGDHVVVRWSARGTHDGAGLGFAPTARRVAFRGMTWLTFSNGLVVEGWDSWNQGALLQSLQTAS
ncbi:MAG TPA: ester cyclase [Thermoanaerobaculia bacterium]|nr:ester cyclase [Thermoanaerobaculia bacterium]